MEFPAVDGGLEGRPGAGTGNTVVIKPAETTPLTVLVFAEICERPTCPRVW